MNEARAIKKREKKRMRQKARKKANDMLNFRKELGGRRNRTRQLHAAPKSRGPRFGTVGIMRQWMTIIARRMKDESKEGQNGSERPADNAVA